MNIDKELLIEKSGEISTILKAMGHPKRLMILCLLRDGEKSVSELEEFCSVSQSQVSNFLKRMLQDGLLVNRRDGNTIFYSIKDTRVLNLINKVQQIFCT